MSQVHPSSDILGLMNFIKKSSNPLTPLYESISNSFESVILAKVKAPEITITFHFSGLLDDAKELEDISIQDNGEGFTPEAFLRFKNTFNFRKGFNNRGTGRIQYLHRFENVLINSIYQDNEGGTFLRKFKCNTFQFIDNDTCTPIAATERKTTVTLNRLKSSKADNKFYSNLKIKELRALLLSRFSLRLHLEQSKSNYYPPRINLVFKHTDREDEIETILESDLLKPHKTGEFKLNYQAPTTGKDGKIEWGATSKKPVSFKWVSFELDENSTTKNKAALCSKDVEVELIDIPFISETDSYNGCRRVVAFYSDFLDKADNVSDSVDRFIIPTKDEVTTQNLSLSLDLDSGSEEHYLFKEDIIKNAKRELAIVYDDILNMQEEQDQKVVLIAKSHGIAQSIIRKINVKLDDDEKTITKKLYEEHARALAKTGYNAKKKFEELVELDPTSNDYSVELSKRAAEFSKIVDSQNKEELARYVIRREMVVDLLGKINKTALNTQIDRIENNKPQDPEGMFHDLIFKRRTSSSLNDLWIINEEFSHYTGCSEHAINKIKMPDGQLLLKDIPKEEIKDFDLHVTRRPDVYLFADEGKCVIIEFKQAKTDLTDHLNQMEKYCKLIAHFGRIPIKQFYCYLIGEKISSFDLDSDFKETATGTWVRQKEIIHHQTRHPLGFTQLEIMKYSDLYSRAQRRNHSFAHKLGLAELLEQLPIHTKKEVPA